MHVENMALLNERGKGHDNVRKYNHLLKVKITALAVRAAAVCGALQTHKCQFNLQL